jgi:hypothetical protein
MIVGLLGFIGSGKGTAGEILVDMGFEQLSFASGVKDVAAVMFDWPRELLEGDTNESRSWREQPDEFWSNQLNKEFTPRLALQLMGTEVGRQVFHEDFWVNRLEKTMDRNKNYVITDVRFRNEQRFVRKFAGVLIAVERGIPPHWYDLACQANSGSPKEEEWMLTQSGVHESEWRWIGGPVDHYIENAGTKEDLKKKLITSLTRSFGQSMLDELNKGDS